MPRSLMNHNFSDVPRAEVPRSVFDMSHGKTFTFDASYLVPILCMEVLPGDTHTCRLTGFSRLATPLLPIMDNMYMETFFFFAQNRTLWDNWTKFMGERIDPDDSIDYTIPTVAAHSGGYAVHSTFDYFDLPLETTGAWSHSALPLRAYQKIYNEWFRDQNLIDSAALSTGDGPDNYGVYVLHKRGKRHDYFTGGLTAPQKGTSQPLPLGSEAPIVGIGGNSGSPESTTDITPYDSSGTNTLTYSNWRSTDASKNYIRYTGAGPADYPWIVADLTNATSATINQLRQAFQIQKLLERDARSGTRYNEVILAHFNVVHPDQSWRPEYLGGGRTRVTTHAVPQTSESGATPQGKLAAYGTANLDGHGFTKSFTEHGYIIGIINVRADLRYTQGIEKHWLRSTRYDYYWPALSNIGMQATESKEIYFDNTSGDDDVFNYVGRYDEYRFKQSRMSGLMRPNVTGAIPEWHLSQEFTTRPVFDQTFIEEDVPLDRAIAVPSEPHFIFDGYFDYRCARAMPTFGVPGLIDHF